LVCTARDGGWPSTALQMTEERARKFDRGIVIGARLSVFGPARSEEIQELINATIGDEQTIRLD